MRNEPVSDAPRGSKAYVDLPGDVRVALVDVHELHEAN